ncbi:glycosyltransferase [uncultured Trichococcus sp.]|uniref:glycosyltransferase n=1 Tax=uncultured Trichococcus sp. TaxID=189665 RepID=UPI0029C67629|nr:glycosyltransferase [uncultured Trichococcus sp.]
MAETRRNQVPQIVEPFQEIDGQPTPSIIVPCHNEEEMVPIFHKEIAAVSDQLSDAAFELIFVNDGSKDATLAELKRLAAVDQRVHYLSFSRGSSTI